MPINFRLEELRKYRDLSLRELGELSGIDYQSLARMEKKWRDGELKGVSFDYLEKLCRSLKVTPSQLIEYIEVFHDEINNKFVDKS